MPDLSLTRLVALAVRFCGHDSYFILSLCLRLFCWANGMKRETVPTEPNREIFTHVLYSDEGRDRGAGEDHIGLGGRRQGQGGAAQAGRDQAGEQGHVTFVGLSLVSYEAFVP